MQLHVHSNINSKLIVTETGVRAKSKARETYYCMMVQTMKTSVQMEGKQALHKPDV